MQSDQPQTRVAATIWKCEGCAEVYLRPLDADDDLYCKCCEQPCGATERTS